MNLLLIALLGCTGTTEYSSSPLPPELSLSPRVTTVDPIAPGDTLDFTVQIDSTGGEDAQVFYTLQEARGTAFTVTVEPPETMAPDESGEIGLQFAPTETGSFVAYLQVTTTGLGPCNEAWAVIRGSAVDLSCDPDDLDCDGQRPQDGDCDDDDPYNGVGFPEVCDGKDNNCTGDLDPGCSDATCGHLAP